MSSPEARVPVRLDDVPAALLMRSEEHLDELVRELRIIDFGVGPEWDDPVPGRVASSVVSLLAAYAEERAAMREEAREALTRGEERATFVVDFPVGAAADARRLALLLDELDRHCGEGRLLTLATSSDVREFRAWLLNEVTTQVEAGATR